MFCSSDSGLNQDFNRCLRYFRKSVIVLGAGVRDGCSVPDNARRGDAPWLKGPVFEVEAHQDFQKPRATSQGKNIL